MKHILSQFMKVAFVGGLCFLIDFGLYTLCNCIGVPYLISGIIGFSVSVIVNYLLSMQYVFMGRDDISKKTEFIVFVVLSIIGLGIDELLLYLGIDLFYIKNSYLQFVMSDHIAEMAAKSSLLLL